jgi:hypothetical protein
MCVVRARRGRPVKKITTELGRLYGFYLLCEETHRTWRIYQHTASHTPPTDWEYALGPFGGRASARVGARMMLCGMKEKTYPPHSPTVKTIPTVRLSPIGDASVRGKGK